MFPLGTLGATLPSFRPQCSRSGTLRHLKAPMPPKLIDSTDRLHLEVDRNMNIKEATIEVFQDIPSEFLGRLADEKTFQDGKFAPDEIKIASIPGALVDHWYRNGFSIWDQNITPQDIIDRLNAEDMSKFITTSRSFG